MIAEELTIEDIQQLRAYLRADWSRYFIDVLGIPEEHVWSKMREIITALQTHRRVAVKAGNGVSKTFTAAGIANCFSDIYGPDCGVITTAPTSKHLEDILWGEIKNQRNNAIIPLGGDITQLDVTRKGYPKWTFTGLTVRSDNITQQAAALQGYHREWILLIFDEASGVPPQIWAAAERLMTNERCYWLVIGNPPINGLGEFVECFKPDSGWAQITISVLDSPNYKESREVIPNVSGRLFVEEQERKYGKDSPRYIANVLGEIPFETEGTYYGPQIGESLRAGYIGDYPYDPGLPVITVTDFGDMHTATVFAQFPYEGAFHIIDYYQDDGGLGLTNTKKVFDSKPYIYFKHFTFWDMADGGPNSKTPQDAKTFLNRASELGLHLDIIPKHLKVERHEATRTFIPQCRFNKERTGQLIDCLRQYKPRRVEVGSVEGKPIYRDVPEENGAQHGADAFGGLAYQYARKGRNHFRAESVGSLSIGDITELEAQLVRPV
jgi:hypothetical protein